jgi:hypothetical protein
MAARVGEVRDEKHAHLTHRQADERDDDRHAGCNEGAEGDEQDDDREHQADDLALRRLLTGEVEDRTLCADAESVGVESLDLVDDRLGVSGRDAHVAIGVGGERDARVRHAAVGTHGRERLREGLLLLGRQGLQRVRVHRAAGWAVATQGLALGIKRVGHAGDRGQRCDLGEQRDDLSSGGGVDSRSRLRRPHDGGTTVESAGVRAAGGQQVGGDLRLGVRKLELVIELPTHGGAEAHHGDQRDEPRDESDNRTAYRPRGQTRHGSSSDCTCVDSGQN